MLKFEKGGKLYKSKQPIARELLERPEGYVSPITELSELFCYKRADGIYKAVLECIIDVDKEELLKALQYDRKQFNVGFERGARIARRNILNDVMDILNSSFTLRQAKKKIQELEELYNEVDREDKE